MLRAVGPGSPCPPVCQLWVGRSCTAAGGLPQAPLPAQDRALVNFNSRTVEKRTVQATRGTDRTVTLTGPPGNRLPAERGARRLLRGGAVRPAPHRTAREVQPAQSSPPLPLQVPAPSALHPPPQGPLPEDGRPSRGSDMLCSLPASLAPGKAGLIAKPRGLAGRPGDIPWRRLRARPVTPDSSRGADWPGRQPWSFNVVGTVLLGVGGQGGAPGRGGGWGLRPEQVRVSEGRGGAAGISERYPIDRCKGRKAGERVGLPPGKWKSFLDLGTWKGPQEHLVGGGDIGLPPGAP